MILKNITFDFPSTISSVKNEFLALYDTDMRILVSKQFAQENIKGHSNIHLDLSVYWAVFVMCVIINHKTIVDNDASYATYNTLYDLDSIALNLQQVNIDIKEVYAIFNLFGYSN